MCPEQGREDASDLGTGPRDPVVGKNSDSKVPPPSLSVQVPPFPSPSVQAPSTPSLSAQVLPIG